MSKDPLKHFSKFLSLVLRHQPEVIGLRLDAQGYVFYCSANGVWLSEHIPPEYIQICEQNHD
ncbi:MAG: RNA 2'-phosphotransferase [Candidatus Sericytochromatia bacterium]|nr:RNA 2'-phosphotransferase [Candidatus Sericytochromatia bacterium]